MRVEERRSVTNAMGRVIYVSDDDPRGTALIEAGGNLNAGSQVMWAQLLAARSWDLVVDVGANYGEMLLGVDLPPGADIVAFEPDPAVRDHLERSLAEAGLRVDVRPEAVSSSVGTAEFLVDESWSGTSRLASGEAKRDGMARAEVSTTTLDTAFLDSTARSACIKVDVEGAEDLVLEGGALLFRRLDDVGLLIEIAHATAPQMLHWASEWRMYVLDLRSRQHIRVIPDGPEIDRLLAEPWVYRQDAILRPALDA